MSRSVCAREAKPASSCWMQLACWLCQPGHELSQVMRSCFCSDMLLRSCLRVRCTFNSMLLAARSTSGYLWHAMPIRSPTFVAISGRLSIAAALTASDLVGQSQGHMASRQNLVTCGWPTGSMISGGIRVCAQSCWSSCRSANMPPRRMRIPHSSVLKDRINPWILLHSPLPWTWWTWSVSRPSM
jgi:hypothetical protein